MTDVEAFHIDDNYALVLADNAYTQYADLLANLAVISAEPTNTGYHLSQEMSRVDMARITANIGGYAPTGCYGNVLSDVTGALGIVNCGAIETLYNSTIITLS
jgi:hypothetical protein